MFTNESLLYEQVTERLKDFQREAEADRLAKYAHPSHAPQFSTV
jgi:hypothetical protein